MRIYAVLAILFLAGVSSYPADTVSGATPDIGLVLTSDKPINDSPQQDEPKPAPLQLRQMHIDSNVTNRYAHTVISSRYANPATKAQEATFSVVLPDTAFISGFVMEIEGKQYKAYVEEKKEAKRIYDAAVASGIGAAHVQADARDSNRFTVSMNVEPHSKVIFNLTYEELLTRKHGKYEMVINLHPGQLVKDLSIDVNINETKPLLKVSAPALRTGNEIVEDDGKQNEYATVNILNKEKTLAHIHFAPTTKQQEVMAKILAEDKPATNGIAGQFVVEYDVERDPTGGQVLVSEDGYFVHFFAPNELKPIPKHVVFVLDVSGSMHGRKIEQLKQAMQVILDQLTPEDYFNLVEFSFSAKAWNLEDTTNSPTFYTSTGERSWWNPPDSEISVNATLPSAFPATPKNIEISKDIIKKMEANGGTNLYDALSTALNITSAGVPGDNPPRPIIIFLTDGEATSGETNSNKIIEMVDIGNSGKHKAALFTLAFGSDANKEFLKKISLKNAGFMRHIYEAADASLQLQDFYKSISSPLLADVKFNYPAIKEGTLTKHKFHTLFAGGELVVAGRFENIAQKPDDLKVHALTKFGPIDFPPQIIICKPRPTAVGELERLWAYMSIKQLLDEAAAKDEKEPAEKKRALDLALKYSFVTPVTSLVVVKPNETKSVETEDAHSDDRIIGSYPIAFASYPGFPGVPGVSSLAAPASAFSGGGFGSGFGGGFGGLAGRPPATYSPPRPLYNSIPLTTTPYKIFSTTTWIPPVQTSLITTTTESNTAQDLPWLKTYLQPENNDILVVDGKLYHLGNNETVVEQKACEVVDLGLAGSCTLLSACPSVYPRIPDFAAYKQYFCTLESEKYAGVCCVH